MKLNPCKCGGMTFLRVIPVYGRWSETLTLNEDGAVKRDGDGDFIRNQTQPKTIRCDSCGKRCPNPDYETQPD